MNVQFEFDMIFADPPYFLSGGGISYQSGQILCIDKGAWDKPLTAETMDALNLRRLKASLPTCLADAILGQEIEDGFLAISKARREEIEDIVTRNNYLGRLVKAKHMLPTNTLCVSDTFIDAYSIPWL